MLLCEDRRVKASHSIENNEDGKHVKMRNKQVNDLVSVRTFTGGFFNFEAINTRTELA